MRPPRAVLQELLAAPVLSTSYAGLLCVYCGPATGSFAALASGGIVLVTNKPIALTLKAVLFMELTSGTIVKNHLDVIGDIVGSASPKTNYKITMPSRFAGA